MITDASYWILLCYFILEMKVVRDLISSSDQLDFDIKIALTKR